jgi:hypothetical protein
MAEKPQANRILTPVESGQHAFESFFLASEDEAFAAETLLHRSLLIQDGLYRSSELLIFTHAKLPAVAEGARIR